MRDLASMLIEQSRRLEQIYSADADAAPLPTLTALVGTYAAQIYSMTSSIAETAKILGVSRKKVYRLLASQSVRLRGKANVGPMLAARAALRRRA